MSTIPATGLAPSETPPLGLHAGEHWYAICTRSRHEKVVDASLRQKGIITFLPLISDVRRWSDRKKIVERCLFPGYTFVRMCATTESYLRILQTSGVVGFVGPERRGVPIPDKQIRDIQTVLAQRVPCAIFPFLRIGQRIRVRGGCLDGVEGWLVGFKGHHSLVMSVETIPQCLVVRIEGYDFEILSGTETLA